MFIKYDNLDKYFEEICKDLEIPESYYEKANKSYKSFANWLGREESQVKGYNPDVFLQGSFKLGTAIKPISEEIHYDIDSVCKFNKIDKNSITQKELKDLMGIEVKSYAKSMNMTKKPKNSKRCWTLSYHDEAQFHIDILPCINDSQRFIDNLIKKSLSAEYKENAVAITDKNSVYYDVISNNWEISNPHGFYLWFKEKTKIMEKKKIYAEVRKMSVEDVPDYKIKTPLQKSIQILKRHRDYTFIENLENKPSSIIITTISAKVYDGEKSIKDILKKILYNINSFILEKNGEYYIPNPVNPMENFADKWNNEPAKKEAFYQWIHKLKEDFIYYDNKFLFYGELFFDKTSEIFGVNAKKIMKTVNQESPYISHKKQAQWKMYESINVLIKAYKKVGTFTYKQFKSGSFLNKDMKLKFEAEAINVRQYDIYWQITNTGKEAQMANDLRGDFYESEIEEGKRVRKESTRYLGSHLVECYLVKNNVCVGKSGPFVINVI
ncbi:MAG: nucleotidyltransferase [Halanaerobiales bacterium]|nr:nucleotidyltransferase [Halanaerobiales bacterium]